MSDGLVDRLRTAGCVFAEDEALLLRDAATDAEELQTLLNRRLAGEPLELVLGWAEIDGLRVRVVPGVFVPRRRTALLAREAMLRLPRDGILVDLCCGSGVVAALVARERPDARIHAVDIDQVAVDCARTNLLPVGGRVHHGDAYDGLPWSLRGRVDVLTANAPYVPTGELERMPREARDHETTLALDGGIDGAALHRRLADGAASWLAPGGALLIETGGSVAAQSLAALSAAGLAGVLRLDHDLNAQVVVGSR